MVILYHAIEVYNIVGLNKTCYAGLRNPEMQPVSTSTLCERTCIMTQSYCTGSIGERNNSDLFV